MKLPSRGSPLILAAMALAIAACGRASPPSRESPAVDTAVGAARGATPVPRDEAVPAPVLDSGAPVAEDFVLSTNEPFWNARVEGAVVVLKGLEGERRLAVTRNQALFDGRLVMARDDVGALEIRITPWACRDSMAGADFPYTGRLTFEGADPIAGCARPASDPPPGEPAPD